jgi:small-conductance mechanosensitive channel
MGKLILRFFGMLVVVQAIVFSPGVGAQTVVSFDAQIDRIDQRISSGRTGSLEERELRDRLRKIADGAALERDIALMQAKQNKGLLDALGPLPTEKSSPETPPIQKQRNNLSQRVSVFEGQAQQAELIIAKAEQSLAKLNLRSRERLKETLFERSLSPLSQKAWAIATPEAAQLFGASFITAPRQWWSDIQKNPDEQALLLRNLLVAMFVALVCWMVGRWLRKRYGRVEGLENPSHNRRLLAGVVEGTGRAIAPIVLVILLGSLLFDSDLVKDPLLTVMQATIRGLVLLFIGHALINAYLTPRRQEWRLFNFSDLASSLLVLRLKLILLTFLILNGLHQATAWATPSVELKSVAALLFTLILAPLVLSVLDFRIWQEQTDSADSASTQLSRVRAFLTVGLVAVPVAAVLGYTGLATYFMRALIMSGLVLAALGLLRSVGRESLAASLDGGRPIGRWVQNMFALDREISDRVLFWLHMVFDLGLVVIAGVALLPVWGLGASETMASLTSLMRGIRIGSYTFSLIDLFIGLFVFVSIVFVTRLIQKSLETHVLPNLTKDKGVSDALKTGVGYIGIIIAALVTISALGLDLTNLALVAGALSVGIGFGLQNVVNNFVSGLILLAERPIKPGDWVVIGGHEGTVKKVNVRSTEIETFQRASVIIPNADLIASPVINWTHKNILGRVEVVVGVAYGTDPQLLKRVLLECAKAHPNVTEKPEPFVLFSDFADSSLNFELRAYLANVERRVHTGSELRYAIHDALKENGIEIPFPQRVVHFATPLATPQGGFGPGEPKPDGEKT